MHWNALQKLIWSIFLWSFFDYCSSTAAFSKLFSVVEVCASLQKLSELRSKDDWETSSGTILLYSQNLSNTVQSIKYFAIYEEKINCAGLLKEINYSLWKDYILVWSNLIGLFYIFLDPEMPSIDLKVLESRKTLWGKTKAAFKYIYEHHRFVFTYKYHTLPRTTTSIPQDESKNIKPPFQTHLKCTYLQKTQL